MGIRSADGKQNHEVGPWKGSNIGSSFNLYRSLYSEEPPPPAVEEEPEVEEDPDPAWVKHDPSKAEPHTTIPAAEGFDLYIDGVRFLPDNATICKVIIIIIIIIIWIYNAQLRRLHKKKTLDI